MQLILLKLKLQRKLASIQQRLNFEAIRTFLKGLEIQRYQPEDLCFGLHRIVFGKNTALPI